MIYLHLADRLGLPVPHRMWIYQLACEQLGCDIALETLESFRLSGAVSVPPSQPSLSLSGVDESSSQSVRGWLGGETREVICRRGGGGVAIDVCGIGGFVVTAPAGHIRCVYLEPDLPRELLEEVLLGPPVTLSLAYRGVWCLHSSAVNLDGGAVLFLGNSGQGKSTLAKYCGECSGSRRIADDIFPCSLVDGKPFAHPHFPQLKLSAADQYPAVAEEPVHLRAIVFLDPALSVRSVRIEPVPRIDAVKRLAGQTVAVSLFDRNLHERHLRFVSLLIESVPMFILHYSHDYERLPEVCDTLRAVVSA